MLRLTENLSYRCRISFHKNQRHIQMDNFRPRHNMVPCFYSYHKNLYTLHHTLQRHTQMDNFRLLDDMVPRCYSYHMSVDIPTRMCYPHNLKTGGTIIQYYRTNCLENLTQQPTWFAHNRAICSTT